MHPCPFSVPAVHFHRPGVIAYAEVLVVASQFLAQLFPLFLYRPMPILLTPLPDGLHGRMHLRAFGLTFDDPVSSP